MPKSGTNVGNSERASRVASQNEDLLHLARSRIQEIRATFSLNLKRNIVALQVEKRCCPYCHLRSQLATQQISMLQVAATCCAK